MQYVSTSKERYSFLQELSDSENLKNVDFQNINNKDWQQNNLEYDLRTTDWILDKTRKSNVYAQNLYAALCNNDFVKNGSDKKWHCSWRYAGGIIAHMKEKGDYIDWYCSGIRNELTEEEEKNLTEEQLKFYSETKNYVAESTITEEIKEDLKKLGWDIIIFDLNQLREENLKKYNKNI